MKRVVLCAVVSLCATFASAQEMPAPYKAVLETLGKTGDFKDNVLKVNIPRNDLNVTVAERQDADAVRLRRLGGDDQGHRRHGRHDGRSRADAGRGQPGDVGAARQRPRGDRAAQSLLLGRAAHVLHARARTRHARRSGAQGEAGARSDRQERPPPAPAPPRRPRRAGADDRHGEDGADRRARRASRTARSTRSPSAATT